MGSFHFQFIRICSVIAGFSIGGGLAYEVQFNFGLQFGMAMCGALVGYGIAIGFQKICDYLNE